jgi:CRISPR system Cascade subunit CasD
MPTKSGIVGLIGCCFGYPRGDERLVALSRALRVAVRTDRPGLVLTDYHTVQGTGGVMLNAQRKKRPYDTIVTPRQYLQDAAFQIFLEGNYETLVLCDQAMKSPHWPPFLGRKCCPPAVPLIPEIVSYPSLEDAVCLYPVREKDLKRSRHGGDALQAEIECIGGDKTLGTEVIRIRPDEVLDAQHDLYLNRHVHVIVVPIKEAGACI